MAPLLMLIGVPTASNSQKKRTMTIGGSKRSRATLEKRCLITVGATAPFQHLIDAALQPHCLAKFKEDGFTHITFQCGDSLSHYHEVAPKNVDGLKLSAFAFKKEGLHDDIFACKARKNVSEQGLVISHAGE
jgi:beta-1,4-N-acetylglucosaminyltransferase